MELESQCFAIMINVYSEQSVSESSLVLENNDTW